MKTLSLGIALLLSVSLPAFASPVPDSESHLTFGKAKSAALNPALIRILVWNIKKGQEAGLDRDLPEYGRAKELLILSEGLLSPPVKSIFDDLKNIRWDMGVSFLSGRGTEYPTGTMIGSRVEPSEVKVRRTLDVEPVIHTPKALTIARYPIAGQSEKLLVISVHGINAVPYAAFARHMEMIAEEVRDYRGPILLAGDFNSNTDEKVSHLLEVTASLGFRNLSFRNDERRTVFGHVIDYIFVRGLGVWDSEVLGKLTSSDHKAMLASLFITPKFFRSRK